MHLLLRLLMTIVSAFAGTAAGAAAGFFGPVYLLMFVDWLTGAEGGNRLFSLGGVLLLLTTPGFMLAFGGLAGWLAWKATGEQRDKPVLGSVPKLVLSGIR